MGEQIIVQPDGRLAVFSTVVDDFIAGDATPDELVRWRARRAADEERERTLAEIGRVLARDADDPRTAPYYQFTLTWEQAVEKAGRDPMTEDGGGRITAPCAEYLSDGECGCPGKHAADDVEEWER